MVPDNYVIHKDDNIHTERLGEDGDESKNDQNKLCVGFLFSRRKD